MKRVLFIIILCVTNLYAQLNTMQSSSDLEWRELENNYVKIYYPDFLEEKAQYIAHLIDHYQKVVGVTYKLDKFEKFPLILRAEMSEPNGFVTLMPRRSEWFSSANIVPFIGGLEWYQALAVHEYRHVIQFDHMFQGYNKSLYYIFGELGRTVGTVLTADAWFFEGDAVWTETKYSDAGRGRSPRFSARLRALVDADYFPTYDNYLINDFEIPLPNHYVYGYFTVANAYQKYGEDIWRKITTRSANYFPQPYKFYSAFKKETKVKFEDFFQSTLKGLKTKDKKTSPKELKKYRQHAFPFVDGYFSYVFKKDLDSFWALYEISGKEKKIKELNIDPLFSIPDIKRGYLVYTQSLPDRRYSFKGYSDIYLLSVYSKINNRITFEKRYYHPKLHPVRNEIFALRFDERNNWSVESLDFEGKILKRLVIPNLLITEFEFIDADTLAIISQDKIGLKTLYQVDLKSKKLIPLVSKTRNNIFALNYSDNGLYFEADYQGKVETIGIDLKTKQLKLCSQAEYANFHPHIAKGTRYYIDLDARGTTLKKEKLSCRKLASDALSNTDKYISNGHADNYIKSRPYPIANYQTLTSKKIKSSEYKESQDLFKFHSWSFIGGRGLQLQANSNNYLNDIAANIAVGMDAEEDRPFANLSLEYLKYYPIYGLNIDYAKRNIKYSSGDNDQFNEVQGTLSITLPYYWRENLFQGYTSLTLSGGAIKVSERERNKTYEASDDTLTTTSAQFTYSNLKDLRYRELLPSAGFTYSILGQKAVSENDDEFSNFLTYQKASYFSDGFKLNHAFKLTAEEERQKESFTSYRISSPSSEVNQYVFSRGYEYEYTPHFFKSTVNYSLPLAYLRWQYKDLLFVKRIYTNLFFDYTKIDINDYERTLNSYGTEFFFDTLTLRKLPITWGLRAVHNMRDEKTIGEIFVGLGIEI